MTEIPFFQVDAFTDKVFGGNPAAVCHLETWLPDATMQKIALENNLPETAFFVRSDDPAYDYHLRWFTPTVEMDLCGHATLASAYCLFEHLGFSKDVIRFTSRSGLLEVRRDENGYTLNFPQWTWTESTDTQEIENILGVRVEKVLKSVATFAVIDDPAFIKNYTPDLLKINTLKNTIGLVLTARGENGIDFISRFFCPQIGIPEDPITGGTHCFLTPYWSGVLGKTTLKAYQASPRGGYILCRLENGRVHMSGQAVLYLKGSIYVA